MKGRVLVTLAAVVLVFALVGHVQAQTLTRVVFNGWTRVQPSGGSVQQQLCLFVVVTLNPDGHPPNFIREITVSAQDGSVFSLDPAKDWLVADHAFYKVVLAGDFKGGKIVGGTYTATVTHTSGAVIKETDSIAATFISIPTVTYPTPGLTGVPAQPTFKWNAVSGATYYRVVLWNADWREPVYNYYDPRNNYQTDLLNAKIPKGILRPNTNYDLQIQARGDSNDVDRRSQTGWIRFTTGSW